LQKKKPKEEEAKKQEEAKECADDEKQGKEITRHKEDILKKGQETKLKTHITLHNIKKEARKSVANKLKPWIICRVHALKFS
jgi:hypothetical protein